MMRAKISPLYHTITQQPYCCIPACVQMILYRRGLAHFEQGEIGADLGLKTPGKYDLESKKVHSEDWGTKIHQKRHSLEKLFKKRNLPLTVDYHCPESVERFPEFVNQNISEGSDILVCFRPDILYNEHGACGHGSLIEEINGDVITLVDPYPGRKRNKASIDDLLVSALEHHRRSTQLGGFWVIK